MGKCKVCGGNTLGDYEYCLKCKPSTGRQRGYAPQSRERPGLPSHCVFKDSFYEPDGYLKREVNIEAAEAMSEILQRERMTQASIRNLFNSVNSIKMKLKTDRDLPSGFIRENFLKFVTQVEYQSKRDVIPEIFRIFVEIHTDLVVKDKKEFLGFADYLTAIVARMKQK
ncbi:MAG: hypothetical protein CVT49_15780 [candidate division Zixibacteria bacterium HGW-Zixibacteria-1]|nr:MAG: hypothetical protein CVT49_15780 [candidate division Zixibacteria bacterium HGW-Zixibacteria-1]